MTFNKIQRGLKQEKPTENQKRWEEEEKESLIPRREKARSSISPPSIFHRKSLTRNTRENLLPLPLPINYQPRRFIC